MRYGDLIWTESSWLARFSHRGRFKNMASHLMQGKSENLSVLDYGCGDGSAIDFICGDLYIGFEPYPEIFSELEERLLAQVNFSNAIACRDLSSLPQEYGFNFVLCLEVLEHLPIDERLKFYRFAREAISTGGKVVVSVPNELGAVGIIKHFNRMIKGHETLNFQKARTLIMSAFYRTVKRTNREYINDHLGFDYREIQRELQENMPGAIVNVHQSPFSKLPIFLNSQVFFVVE
jgi:SAM-dependent methyltransferase